MQVVNHERSQQEKSPQEKGYDNMKRRIIHIVLAVILALSLAVPSFAIDTEDVSATQVITYNEYDYISALQDSTNDELAEIGMNEDDVQEAVIEFENALAERSLLSDEELFCLGYDSEEIELLRNYSKGVKLSDAELRGVTGTCTGAFENNGVGTRFATFTYKWEWDHAPVVRLSDCAAMRWIAYDSHGYEISTIRTYMNSEISYRLGSSTYQTYTRSGVEEPGLDFNTVNIQFNVEEFYGDAVLGRNYYAKFGKIMVSIVVDDSVSNDINYILVAGLYGHTIVGIGSPSVSAGIPGSVSIGFSGNTSIDSIAGRQAKLSGISVDYIV